MQTWALKESESYSLLRERNVDDPSCPAPQVKSNWHLKEEYRSIQQGMMSGKYSPEDKRR
jgi:hypothetical protein